MKSLVIIVALLCVKTFCMMRIGKPAPLVRTAKIDGTLCQPQSVSDIPHMNQQDILEMCKSYSKSEKRLILIGKHRIPDNNEEEKKEIDAALLLLAAERRDEIWMVISEDVKEIEDAYGHIPNLNFAGHGGIQFSKKNTAYVELPDASRIEGIEAEANTIVQELNIPLKGNPPRGEYHVSYWVPDGGDREIESNRDKAKQMAAKCREFISMNPEFKDYQVSNFVGRFFTTEEEISMVRIKHKKYGRKGFFAEALLERNEQRKVGFALSIGSKQEEYFDQGDEEMHRVMKLGSHYSIIIQKEKMGDIALKTFASHRLDDHKEFVSLLKTLAETKELRL